MTPPSTTDVAAGTSSPDESKKTPLWVKIMVVVGALPAIFAVGIFIFLSRYSMAFNDQCPYVEVETRDVGGGDFVRQESRRCMDSMEEHRWVLQRGTADELELGRYPLEGAHFSEGFPWRTERDDGRLVVRITNPGRGEFVLREPEPGME